MIDTTCWINSSFFVNIIVHFSLVDQNILLHNAQIIFVIMNGPSIKIQLLIYFTKYCDLVKYIRFACIVVVLLPHVNLQLIVLFAPYLTVTVFPHIVSASLCTVTF